jgi:hypothetical protein
MAIVYQHRRLDTGEIFYIGVGKEKKRAFSTKSRNKHWRNVVKKAKGFEADILLDGISWEEAIKIEIGMIHDIGRKDLNLGPLVNETDGGEGRLGSRSEEEKAKHRGYTHTSQAIEKMKLAALNREKRTLSNETKNKISNSNKGKQKPTRSQEHKDNISKSRKGKQMGERSQEIRDKISLGKKGLAYRKIECEYCKKLIAINGNNYDRHISTCKFK